MQDFSFLADILNLSKPLVQVKEDSTARTSAVEIKSMEVCSQQTAKLEDYAL
jgi:hypothetical protein